MSRTGNGRGPLYRGQRYWHGIWNIGATFFIPYGAMLKHRQRPLSGVLLYKLRKVGQLLLPLQT